jgi:hypothetical protein
MGKIKCPHCESGFIHTSGNIPNENEFLIIADSDFINENDTIEYETLYGKMIHAFKCISCGSIGIFWNGMQNETTWYKP